MSEVLDIENHMKVPSHNATWERSSRSIHFTDTVSPARQIRSPSDLIYHIRDVERVGVRHACIIENISPEYIAALISECKLEAAFFEKHASNPEQHQLWNRDLYRWDWDPASSDPNKVQYTHMDGIFEYHGIQSTVDAQDTMQMSPNASKRLCFRQPPFPIQSNTRVSYYRVHPWLYLFLVDAPLNILQRYSHLPRKHFPTLRFLHALNRGGMSLPQDKFYAGRNYSIFDNLCSFFEHRWHLDILFSETQGVIPAPPFTYLLACSLWSSNLRYLTNDINQISFEALRNLTPEISHINEINDRLHDRREDLARLKSGLQETIFYVPEAIAQYFKQHSYYAHPTYFVRPDTPIERLSIKLDEAKELDALLNETFKLFMSSIAIQDSKVSIEQAKVSNEQAQRTTRITQLAFIYVPLSFVTSVFSMNVKELNGTGQRLWAPILLLVVTILITLAVFWALSRFGRWRTKQKEEAGGRLSV